MPEIAVSVATANAQRKCPDHAGRVDVRRWVEAAIAGVILLVIAVPLALIWLAIRIDSPGPAIFRQSRLGQNLRPFTFYKFRTMYIDARARFPELYDYKCFGADNPNFFFKHRADPRVTRVGQILRRTALDELPNLFNILLGDIAFVGPRPDIPEMLPHYNASQAARFDVPQGLVCLAQVRGANRLSFRETADLDAEYARARTIWKDLKILFLVFAALVRGDLH